MRIRIGPKPFRGAGCTQSRQVLPPRQDHLTAGPFLPSEDSHGGLFLQIATVANKVKSHGLISFLYSEPGLKGFITRVHLKDAVLYGKGQIYCKLHR